jgi:hypothetical protein
MNRQNVRFGVYWEGDHGAVIEVQIQAMALERWAYLGKSDRTKKVADAHWATVANRENEGTRKGFMNQDWNIDLRRLKVTENAIEANDKYLSRLKPGEQVKWLPFPGSCKYCQALAGRVFRVVEASQKEKNPEEEVWVGKVRENKGKRLNPLIRLPSGRLRKRRPGERESPAAPLHEHCRCTWIALPPPIGGLVVTKSKESAVGQRPDPVDAQGRISPDVGISPASLEPGKTKKGPPLPRRPYTPLYVDRRRK